MSVQARFIPPSGGLRKRPSGDVAGQTRVRHVLASVSLLLAAASWAGPRTVAPAAGGGAETETDESAGILFEEVASVSGLDFRHYSGASPEKYTLETVGSGVAFLDFDNDGWLDIYFVNGGPVPGRPPPGPIRHALFRNQRDGTFLDVTAGAGVEGNGRYGSGVAAADYDGDGWTDLFVTAFGRNLLYRNARDGTFVDETDRAGLAGGQWSTSAAFLDYDQDGDLDLFVARYVDFDFDRNLTCGDPTRGIRAYCHPDVYDGVPSLLYRNNGDGTFSDVSQESGIAAHVGKSLGVIAADLDEDGRVDLYVANDSVANFLFRNRGSGRFEEVGLISGVALDEGGRPQAGMGTAVGDLDGDGRLDLMVSNLDGENNNLFRNEGSYFADTSFTVGFASPSLPMVGWGIGACDFDNDGDLDVLVVNGHVIDNVEQLRPGTVYRQPVLLLENLGRRFRQLGGDPLESRRAGRSAAFGDYDNDGDVDVVISELDGPPALLRNETRSSNRWLSLELMGTRSPADAIGTRVLATVGGRVLTRYLEGGGSYLASNDHRIHLGLGPAKSATRIEIRWPSGERDVLENLASGRFYRVLEGQGLVEGESDPGDY